MMNTAVAKEEHGECPACKRGIKLIYKNPEIRDGLMIGPHHPELENCKLEDIGNQNCSGFRQPPTRILSSEFETTAQK